MKKLMHFSLLIFSILFLSACELLREDEFDLLPTGEIVLPDTALDFIQARFPDHRSSEQEYEDLCDNTEAIKVELEDGPGPDIDLYFSLEGAYLFSATEIPVSELPVAVLTTIDSAFANYSIDASEVERLDFPDGNIQFAVELNDATGEDYDLILTENGTIICWERDHPDDDDGEDDDDNGNANVNLPDSVRAFVSSQYAGYRIEETEREDLCEDDVYFFKIELEDGPGPDIDLYFSLNWEFRFTATEISASELPAAVRSTIDGTFADYTINASEVERLDFPDGSVQYKVELLDSVEEDYDLILDGDGNTICWERDYNDDDDDDNDDNGDGDDNNGNSTLPDSVRAFVSSQFAGYRIDEVEREDLCDDVYFFKVELEDGPGPDIDLYFSLDWEFRFTATEIPVSELPDTVTDALAIEFPGAEIDDDKVERLEFPDGSVQYAFEVETGDDDYDLIYGADGTLICNDRN